ncbi:(+)-neomenthol dehydrogenase-like [Gastrolobium bilobum]|uniref:(+)-neomenthol dehydrogenase-like n=1 Tax=Gastrolobium bilobum TaxID=150636 RepID=UPI002AB01D70|nr:(+)-neomenthol dehydrogenase-like [Gastrolobium bilobum]
MSKSCIYIKKRFAVVTGANKGIGYGICKKLASIGIVVVLTARNEKRGLEAMENLKEFGLSDFLVFHQLDVTDPASVASLADFIKTKFGKLDILVNNAGVAGGIVDGENVLRQSQISLEKRGEISDWNIVVRQNYELAEECVKTNFLGAERVTEALLPLLQLSTSPRIVNISAIIGRLKYIPNEWARGVFGDIENLTNEKLEEVLKEFLKDYKEGSLETKNWPGFLSGYTMSKTALNAYTMMLAKKFPRFRINCICPDFVKTDINQNTGFLSIDEGAESPVKLALLPDDGPSGLLFSRDEVFSF